jgi:hypothetical protein
MTKTFCDCCGKEQTEKRMHKFSYLLHLSEDRRGELDNNTDTETKEPISGRFDIKEMCIICYNATVSEGVRAFEKLRDELGEENK